MNRFSRFANTLFILVLMFVLSAAYYEQFTKHESPCPLCMLQRVGMFGVALGLCLNLRKGIEPLHYGFSILFALFGGAVSLRHIALHVCSGFSAFGIPVFGYSLYTWAFIVFFLSLFSIGTLLLLYAKEEEPKVKMNRFEWVAFFAVLILLVANCISTYQQCSFSPCEDLPWPQTSEHS